ncbi:pleurocidin-like peptide WF3 [Pholidichthys leucotaenia]
MKCITLFLVLSMVVLMAEPGEAFFGALIKLAGHGARMIHELVQSRHNKHGEQLDQQEQLNQRLFQQNRFNQERAAFA